MQNVIDEFIMQMLQIWCELREQQTDCGQVTGRYCQLINKFYNLLFTD